MIYALDAVGLTYPSRRGVVRSLAEVSFTVAPGERVAVIGPSGAGKTTLFRLLNATLRPTAGALRFHGEDVAALAPRATRAMRRRIGTIHQQALLVPSLTVLENALCGALGRWSLLHAVRTAIAPARGDAAQAMHALEQVGLADKRDARADELSGGQQQRVAIARLIMQDPEVMLADEPFAALDPALADAIAALLLGLASAGRTLVCTLHDVARALALFPRVIALRDGRVMFDAPSDTVTAAMLDALYHGHAERPAGPPDAASRAAPARSAGPPDAASRAAPARPDGPPDAASRAAPARSAGSPAAAPEPARRDAPDASPAPPSPDAPLRAC